MTSPSMSTTVGDSRDERQLDLAPIKARVDAASVGPWAYNGYSGIASVPLLHAWDAWTDAHEGHEFERTGKCEPCGSDAGCEFAEEYYERYSWIGWVPSHHGDTATGRHAADAEFIAHAREDIPALVAEIEMLRAMVARVSRPFDLMAALRCQTRCKPPFHAPGCYQRTALTEEIHRALGGVTA